MMFPPQPRICDFVRSSEATESQMFPLEKPFKLLYSINALSVCVRDEMLEDSPVQAFLGHTIDVLVAFLTRREMATLEDSPLKLSFAASFVDCLLLALKAKSLSKSGSLYFPHPSDLSSRLVSFMHFNRFSSGFGEGVSAIRLIVNSFSVLVEASLHDPRVWHSVNQGTQVKELIFLLLLSALEPDLRKGVVEIVLATCDASSPPKQVSKLNQADGAKPPASPITVEILSTLWTAMTDLFPESLAYSRSSQEFFDAALALFRTVSTLSPVDTPRLGEYLHRWGGILLQHRTEEFVGRELVDYVVLGFVHLLKMCLSLADSPSILANTRYLMVQLFTTYLFPPLSDVKDDEEVVPRIPVMHEITRQEIYLVILLLCEDPTNCRQMLSLLEDVMSYDASEWGSERQKMIRSLEGYAGLKNLSNTCYLNSLMTQLFMNVGFRKFVLEIPIEDAGAEGNLLWETKKVLAHLQNTWQKSVDPQDAVEYIRTYDNEQIDINIQMDVDEFYSLLFDRWEAQLKSNEEKKVMRSFYGGQLVQQIKSKECDHISERLEPFSAIQCDIKGKSCLEDSLRAYVEGEIMQGDNKYSCTSCGRHVDAVKRACLKELPDNLIFHLKRFDFDVITMMRSKINDEFRFPERIDMTPYKVEYLSEPTAPVEPDIFELVGVLVHSGTAESGHYYSYIRERPLPEGADSTWVEFNDSDVSRFDPARIPDQCFGGTNDSFHSAGMGPVRFNKVWSAYMLFYQRASGMEKEREALKPQPNNVPVHVPVPLDLANHISMENEVFIRTYCLLDPFHSSFVLALFRQSRRFDSANNESAGQLQQAAISVAFDALDQLVVRTKEPTELKGFLMELHSAIKEDDRLAVATLEWTLKRQDSIWNLLLRCPDPYVRTNFGRLLYTSLVRIQMQLGDDVQSISPEEGKARMAEFSELLESIVMKMAQLWTNMHAFARGWDNYFELLMRIASLEPFCAGLVVDHGFLLRCLEIIWLDPEDLKKLKRKYAPYCRLIDKGRKYSQVHMMELFFVLLRRVDLNSPPIPDGEARATFEDREYPLTASEADYVYPRGRNNELLLMKKIIEQQSNPSYTNHILAIFLESDPQTGFAEGIFRALAEGLRLSPADLSAPFLDTAVAFCQTSADINQVISLLDHTARGVDSIHDSGGRDHLDFFSTLLTVSNERLEKDETWFATAVVERIPLWVPPLLAYPERGVRNDTVVMLRDLLFARLEDDDEDEDDGDGEPADTGDDIEVVSDQASVRQFCHCVGRELARALVTRLRRAGNVLAARHADARAAQMAVSMDVQALVDPVAKVLIHAANIFFDGETEEDLTFVQLAKRECNSVLAIWSDGGGRANAAIGTIVSIEALAREIPEEFAEGT